MLEFSKEKKTMDIGPNSNFRLSWKNQQLSSFIFAWKELDKLRDVYNERQFS